MSEDGGQDNARKIALEARTNTGARLFSPSAARNRDAIRDAFIGAMPRAGSVLEIGSGTGEHGVHIARAAPGLTWHGGDLDPASRASLAAWIAHSGLNNMRAPHAIDVTCDHWGTCEGEEFTAIMSANMVHIAPFSAAEGLFAGAGRRLGAAGKLFLYGPFSRNGSHSAASNEAFDRSLRARNPAWGVRDLDRELIPLAQAANLSLAEIIAMPANNLAVIFARAP